MLSTKQAEDCAKSYGLQYRIEAGESGKGTWIWVLDKNGDVALKYNPFSCWIKDMRTGEKSHYDTVSKFKQYCKKLADED